MEDEYGDEGYWAITGNNNDGVVNALAFSSDVPNGFGKSLDVESIASTVLSVKIVLSSWRKAKVKTVGIISVNSLTVFPVVVVQTSNATGIISRNTTSSHA